MERKNRRINNRRNNKMKHKIIYSDNNVVEYEIKKSDILYNVRKYKNGSESWWLAGSFLRHRENGPALMINNLYHQYWFKNKFYPEIRTNKQWREKIKELIIEDIIT